MFKMILKHFVLKASILFWRAASITYVFVTYRRTLRTDALKNLSFSLISTLHDDV